jgi:hypothetical protein
MTRIGLVVLFAGTLLGGCRSRGCEAQAEVLPCPTLVAVDGRFYVDLQLYVVAEEHLAYVVGGDVASSGGQQVLTKEQGLAVAARVAERGSEAVSAAPQMIVGHDEEGSVRVGETDAAGTWTGFKARVSPRSHWDGSLRLDLRATLAQPGVAERRIQVHDAALPDDHVLLVVGAQQVGAARLAARLHVARLVGAQP